jgi:hypothetical protein
MDGILTSLHPKGHSDTKKNNEERKGQQSIRRSHVIFIGGRDDHQGKNHCTNEFVKKTCDISQVVELELQAVNKLGLIQLIYDSRRK